MHMCWHRTCSVTYIRHAWHSLVLLIDLLHWDSTQQPWLSGSHIAVLFLEAPRFCKRLVEFVSWHFCCVCSLSGWNLVRALQPHLYIFCCRRRRDLRCRYPHPREVLHH